MSQENKTQNTICYFEDSMLPENFSWQEKNVFLQSQLSEEVEEEHTQNSESTTEHCQTVPDTCLLVKMAQHKNLSTCGRCPKTNLFTGEVYIQQ